MQCPMPCLFSTETGFSILFNPRHFSPFRDCVSAAQFGRDLDFQFQKISFQFHKNETVSSKVRFEYVWKNEIVSSIPGWPWFSVLEKSTADFSPATLSDPQWVRAFRPRLQQAAWKIGSIWIKFWLWLLSPFVWQSLFSSQDNIVLLSGITTLQRVPEIRNISNMEMSEIH